LIEHPVSYGQSFNRPSAKMIRKARNAAGPKMFEAAEIKMIVNAADVQLKAMILLGINAGFGNTDVASLPQSAVDLDSGWADFPRPKTEIPRRVPLWPETITAIESASAVRPKSAGKSENALCFLTVQGNRWVRVQEKRSTGNEADSDQHQQIVPIDSLSQKFAKLLKTLGINGHRNFYALRHTFETIAGESRDQVAVNAIMGHVDSSMAGVYRERISDERLQAVVGTVHNWLFKSN
jgi:integrase